jgi:CDP-glucose 4,6-dehydratase
MEGMARMKQYLQSAYQGKKVLLTGHTGFKGSWLSIWLMELGADVIGYALDPKTERDNFVLTGLSRKMKDIRGDIRDRARLMKVFQDEKPDIIFHLAAQSLVFLSYEDPLETFESNVMGTVHVLEAVRQSPSVHTGVMITSDKCYENRETIWGYREDDPMGGYDPYSASKGAAELLISSYRKSFMSKNGKAVASARAGNVVGGGDWSKYRLIPDIVRAFEAGQPVELRHPRATRPWQHVLQPLAGYLWLGARLMERPREYAEAWNFGPFSQEVQSVQEVVEKMIHYLGKGTWRDLSTNQQLHEDSLLTLDITKAVSRLHWQPVLTLDDTMRLTAEWYKKYPGSNDMYALCRKQMNEYMERWQRDEAGLISLPS